MAEAPDIEVRARIRTEIGAPVDPHSVQEGLERLHAYAATLSDALDRLGLRLSSVTRPEEPYDPNAPVDVASRAPAAPLTEQVHGLADRFSVCLDRLQRMTDRIDLP